MNHQNNQLVKGLLWSGIDKFGFVLIQLVMDYILIQLLSPKDYGAIGAILIITSFSIMITEGGFSNALIQKLNRTEEDFSTVFLFNILVSFFLYFVLILVSHFIEDFFRIENLSKVLNWVGLIIIFNAATLVHKTKLSIELNYKLQAKISLFSVIISGIISIFLAYSGYGIWSLAAQILVMNFLSTLLLWIFFRWSPRFVFSRKSFIGLFGFGSKILISSILQSIFFNAYPLVIGRIIGSSSLGLYSKANQFSQMPANVLSNVLQRVLFPYFSNYQEDNKKLIQLHSIYSKMVAVFFMPLFYILAFFSFNIVELILPSQWKAISYILFLLLIAYSFYPLIVQNMMILQIKNKPNLFLKVEVLIKIMGFLILLITIPLGFEKIIEGVLIHQFFQFLITSFISQKTLESNSLEQIKSVAPILLFSSIILSYLVYNRVFVIQLIHQYFFIFIFFIFFFYVCLYFVFYRNLHSLIIINFRSKKID